MADVLPRLGDALEALPRGLREHVLRVETEAIALAERHRLDRDTARIAALGHDLARHVPDDRLIALAIEHGGKLATFDTHIPAHVLPGGVEALEVIVP